MTGPCRLPSRRWPTGRSAHRARGGLLLSAAFVVLVFLVPSPLGTLSPLSTASTGSPVGGYHSKQVEVRASAPSTLSACHWGSSIRG
ncbi:MAG: hypothetical protein L3K04_06730, partial [Thermoplasmata archaeon]|nr:hypothetical protein [Thermoplasmata archaeon]